MKELRDKEAKHAAFIEAARANAEFIDARVALGYTQTRKDARLVLDYIEEMTK